MQTSWHDTAYLLHGTARQRAAYHALDSLNVFYTLRAYDPVLVGTIPINLDVAGSDLDIICGAYDLAAFRQDVADAFGDHAGFRIVQLTINDLPSVIANFVHDGFAIELFAQSRPVTAQNAYVHMVVEAQLLRIGGKEARTAIRELKRQGLKTEPAFARYFGLDGDPFATLLELAAVDDAALRAAVGR